MVVRSLSRAATHGILSCGNYQFRCALGKGGIRALKREGDGATPLGRFAVRHLAYRPDHGPRPRTMLPTSRLRPQSGWCDAPSDRNYNRAVQRPYPASAELMWRADALYDLVGIITYNERPRRRGRGSAIFMHLARPGYQPTEGCIALSKPDLRRLLTIVGPNTRLWIGRR